MIAPVPEDFHTITPQLVVKGVAGAIDWYARALGAHELLRNMAPDGTSIMHAELLLGDSRFFVVDEFEGTMKSPATLWGDRYGILSDPYGHRWSIASRIEDLSPRALQQRAADWTHDQKDHLA
jgi:PhnB protein